MNFEQKRKQEHNKYIKYSEPKHYRLETNIDLKNINWDPFQLSNAIFDGNNHTISNLVIKSESNSIGLFKSVDENSVIQNLIIDNAYLDGKNCIGIISRKCIGKIYNCHVKNSKIIGENALRGLIGSFGNQMWENKIKNSSSNIIIHVNHNLGGLTGYLELSKIKNCFTNSFIYGNDNIGGTFGIIYTSEIYNTYNISEIISNKNTVFAFSGFSLYKYLK